MLPCEVLRARLFYDYRPTSPPFDRGWCGHPVLTAVGSFLFVQGCRGEPLSATDPGGRVGLLHILFGSVLDDPGRLLVLWGVLLRGWLVCGSYDGPKGTTTPQISITLNFG